MNMVCPTAVGVERRILGRIDLRVGHRLDHVGQRGGQGAERRDGGLAVLHWARVDEHGHDHQLAVELGGHHRHGWGGQDVDDARQLLGRGVGGGDDPGQHLGGGRQQQQPAQHPVQRAQPELEARRHPEVAAAAAQRPEQVRVVLGVGTPHLAVGGHHLGGQQVVDRQAVLSDQVADATGQRDPADADRAGVAEPGRQAMHVGGGGVLAGGQARLRPGAARLGVDVERVHGREVEHDPPVEDAVPGETVAATADGQLQSGLARQRDDPGDVGGVGGLDNQ